MRVVALLSVVLSGLSGPSTDLDGARASADGAPASTDGAPASVAGTAFAAGTESAAGTASAGAVPRRGAHRWQPVSSPRADSLRLVDDRGDTLRLERPASRVVSLIPAVTEILFALGAGETVVGRTRYGVHPPAARRVPSVGEGIRPSAEMVVSRQPEVVVVYVGAANRGAIRELVRLGVPTLAVRHNTLSELEVNVRRLGRLVARREAADSLVRRIRRELDRVDRLTASRPVRSVYYDLWADPPITVGAGSYLDSLIVLAGGRNVFHDLERPSSQVGLEAIAARSPDLVISARESGRRGRRVPPAERPGWRAIPAVRQGRVAVVEGDLLHRLGPRVAEAAAALAAVIHPEIAGDLRREGFPVEGAAGREEGTPAGRGSAGSARTGGGR